MAFDTVRTNKLRSGLTVLGVVIGITSIVAMTALIRGFDQSLQDSISAAMDPARHLPTRFGIVQFCERPRILGGDQTPDVDQRATRERSQEQATSLAAR